MAVLLVEDWWLGQGIGADLEVLLGRPVTPLASFGELAAALERCPEDDAERPLVVLDPGVPGVCRLDAVHQARALHPTAAIVVWTLNREPSFHAACLLDGASAAVSKDRPASALAGAIERADRGHYDCAPAQAQWFVDFLDYLQAYRARGSSHAWSVTKLIAHHPNPEWRKRLLDVATGDPLDADAGWFAELVSFVESLWMEPRLRQAMLALAVHGARAQAAAAIDKSAKTFDGYCAYLSSLLMPARYLSGEREPGLALAGWVLVNHGGCELTLKEHSLDGEASVPSPAAVTPEDETTDEALIEQALAEQPADGLGHSAAPEAATG